MIESAESERKALIIAGKITGDIINFFSNLCENKKDSDRLIKLEKYGIWIDECFLVEFTLNNQSIVLKLSNKKDNNGDYTALEFSYGYCGSKDMPIPVVKITIVSIFEA